MAQYPTFTLADVALASMEEESSYDRAKFVPEAIRQATLLFKIGTCLAQWPDDELAAETARMGVLDMANAIYWAQPWQKVLRSPFNSETIGSYSYSKLNSAVAAGLPTGVSWFDMAMTKLSVCDTQNGGAASGGWNVFEENKEAHDGYGVYLGPADQPLDDWGPDSFSSRPEGV